MGWPGEEGRFLGEGRPTNFKQGSERLAPSTLGVKKFESDHVLAKGKADQKLVNYERQAGWGFANLP
jgi:hypothetical protein